MEKATLSIDCKKTVKALFRRAKAYTMKGEFERAIKDMEEAVMMDPSDPNDLQQEIIQLKHKQRAEEKKATQKMQGFLLKW